MPSGLVAIENIKTGDKVVSTNAETFEIAEKNVIETYIRQTKKLVHLTINGELIQTTTEHPFYVKNHGFVNADELQIGDELLDVKGNVLLIEDATLEVCVPAITVYNFEVADFHTYHIGQLGVLVHNARCERMGRGNGNITWDQQRQKEQANSISKELRSRGVPENVIKDNLHGNGYGYTEGLQAALEFFGLK